ncbi:MAG: hydroxymethylglutaryl-CoA reductase, degradative [Deltaproteobacteria bacterium]|nr:hydroxymethylglutaryl-CoA reductase, degradative [Deltaproteobacteria bacterium]
MVERSSRLPGFHRLSRGERLAEVARWIEEDPSVVEGVVARGALDADWADHLIENVLGVDALPFSVAPNFVINGCETLVPMVTEEASVVAAAANAARICREGGGFRVRAADPVMICQIQLFADDLEEAERKILAAKKPLLDAARGADPKLSDCGGGPVDIEVRQIEGQPSGQKFLVVHLLVDVRDAMGANAVNTMGEAIAPRIEALTGGGAGLCILSNLADRRLVTCEVAVPVSALSMGGFGGGEVRDGIVAASRFAELDPYRAATHNKGIMNGVDAVVLAAGNDWRAVEAGAHAYASRGGRYRPLAIWRCGSDGVLQGVLEMPLAVGTVGGMTVVHPVARLAVRIAGAKTSSDLAAVAAAAGLANNLAALRALSTEGIQKGHMRLHRRGREGF